MDKQQLTQVIASVSQPAQEGKHLGTAWTMVMDLTTPSVTYYSRRHFDKPFHFEFERDEQTPASPTYADPDFVY